MRDPQLAGLGYPQFPGPVYAYSRHLRKAKQGWWWKQEKTNFGETLHESDDVLTVFAPDVYPQFNWREAGIFLSCVVAVLGASVAAAYAVTSDGSPWTPRTYPYGGLVQEITGTDDQSHALPQENGSIDSKDDE